MTESTPINIKRFLLGDDPDTTASFHGVLFRNEGEGGFYRSNVSISDCKRTVILHEDFKTREGAQRQMRKLRELAAYLMQYCEELEVIKNGLDE